MEWTQLSLSGHLLLGLAGAVDGESQGILGYSWELVVLVTTVLGPVLTVATLLWVLASRKDATSTVAWCLVLFILPLIGPLLFFLFGYQHVSRPLRRKLRHRHYFSDKKSSSAVDWQPVATEPGQVPPAPEPLEPVWDDFSKLAVRFGAFPRTSGNALVHYDEGTDAFAAMLEAIAGARHHIHLETFIFQPDAMGKKFLAELSRKAKEGVEVRLLYDAMGTRRLGQALLEELLAAGGRDSVFLPISPLRRRFQINMRNHRKILVVDGEIGFVGGLNVGDEYCSKDPRFGFWRDTHLRLAGPAVSSLQQVFIEDWDFASGENLSRQVYFPPQRRAGRSDLQIIASGPDLDVKSIREVYFAAILQARERIWIATPYFIPDNGLLDALCLAGRRGLDVRLLGLYYPDKWVPYFAGRYYWDDVLRAGIRVYQYTKGMMHSKVLLVDDGWASVGSANLDNRSLHLNFEANCLIYHRSVIGQLEDSFLEDFDESVLLDRHIFPTRPFASRLVDNTARLMSPVL